VGDDPFGSELRSSLELAGIDMTGVETTPDCSSGVAIITVAASGENSIVIVGGANARQTPRDVERHESLIASADAVLLQLEIPLETVAAAVSLARRHRALVVLDPAPAPTAQLPGEVFSVDILSPNQTEAEALTGLGVSTVPEAEEAARRLQQRGCRNVIMKLGELGSLCLTEDGRAMHVPAFEIEPLDTTAAGDAFTGALAVGWTEGMAPQDAVRFACAAGALACTRLGAGQAMPRREEVERLCRPIR
jgi:ribokinase